MNIPTPLANIRVVLVETSHPGNLGAAARAMKVMGLSDLALVNPKCTIDDEARARASGAVDVLDHARIHTCLDAALADVALAAACTSRRRDLPHPAYTPRQAAPQLLGVAATQTVALVFGSETFGLSNEHLAKCRWLLNIPSNPDYSSLNLGSAVQVVSYELRSSLDDTTLALPEFELATQGAEQALITELEKTLIDLGFLNPANPKRLMPRLRRFFAKAGLEKDEVAIWRGVLGAVQARMNNAGRGE